jgi:2-hydroxychromene-2-carboxylate isomerase
MPKHVDFFYDLSSPYSYMGATQIEKVARRAGATVAFRPMVLGAVFKATGNDMPARIAAKARWMLDDLARWAKLYGVPFQMSSRFPVNAIRAMRLVLVAGEEGKEAALTHAAFRALWVDDLDLTADETLRALATGVGLDADRALTRIEDNAVKARLRENTDEAIRRGAFGAPAMFVGDQLFWGNDRLHFVEEALSGG